MSGGGDLFERVAARVHEVYEERAHDPGARLAWEDLPARSRAAWVAAITSSEALIASMLGGNFPDAARPARAEPPGRVPDCLVCWAPRESPTDAAAHVLAVLSAGAGAQKVVRSLCFAHRRRVEDFAGKRGV